MEEETLLIVGNGFDLSMGFKTSYGDFMQSSFYPKNNSTLCSYLLKEYRANMGWIDIENELSKYSKLLSSFELKSEQDELKWGVAAFRKQYEDLKLSLKTYLYEETKRQFCPKQGNPAKRVIDQLPADSKIVLIIRV